MATGKAAQVLVALLDRLTTVAVGSPALPIAWPDVNFDPESQSQGGKYLAASFFPNRPAWEGVTQGVLDQGLLQVDVVWPENLGLIDPLEAAEEIRAHFAKGTTLFSGSTKVTINREPWVSAPVSESSETRVPVTIPWVA